MISIIVPVHNAERFLKETIESVLAQTEKNFELILVDDCSTDGSVNVINGFDDRRICLIRQPENKGAAAARNRGLEAANGRYIAFLDADDLWSPNKLERTLFYLREQQTGFVFTGYEFADENGKGTGAVVKVPKRRTFKTALNNTDIFTSTVMLDRHVIGDELIRMPYIKSEDTATWWNILKAGHTAAGLNENLVKYRRSSGSLSSDKMEALRRIWNLYRKIAGLNVVSSAFHFCLWAITAVWRRL
ncbi:MAG: glycosyltransferase [Lachnospiraceae bacterium]|nr:glycosyltransferase [Lachnospiraceae bacterium]